MPKGVAALVRYIRAYAVEFLPLSFFFGANLSAIAVSVYLFVGVLRKVRRKAALMLAYAAAMTTVAVVYGLVVAPWTKGNIPLFTGSAFGFGLLLVVHTAIPCVAWLVPGLLARHLLGRKTILR